MKRLALIFLLLCVQALAQKTSPITLTSSAAIIKGNDFYCVGGTPRGGTDGVATLPQRCFQTAVGSTPSNGTVRTISNMNDWHNAIEAMACGDQLVITSGVTLTFSTFILPAKKCPNSAYITIRSNGTTNESFPAEGTRMTPCFANKATYPPVPQPTNSARDVYPCRRSTNLLATFLFNATSGNGFQILGDHYRFMGIEFTRVNSPSGNANNVSDLIACTTTSCHDVIIDRCWVHGVEASGTFPQTSATHTATVRGFDFGQSNTVAIIDSYFSDFYVIGSLSAQTESAALGGGFGTAVNSGWGNWKVINNHIEGSSQGFLFGGSSGPTTASEDIPLDLEIRRNEFFKPLSWQSPANNTTTGWPIEKNGFEFKNAGQILVEGNYIKNAWFNAQVGQAYLVAPKNQGSQAVVATVTDANILSNVATLTRLSQFTQFFPSDGA